MDLLGPVMEMTCSNGQQEETVRDLLTIRRAMAVAVLDRLSKGIRSEDQRRITQAIDTFGEAVERGAPPSELSEFDARILGALVAATGSPVLGLCLNPVLNALGQLPALSQAMYARPGENLVGWRLFEAWLGRPDSFPQDQILGQLEKSDLHTLRRMRGPQ